MNEANLLLKAGALSGVLALLGLVVLLAQGGLLNAGGCEERVKNTACTLALIC
jgi:hypothetical protein